MKEKKLHYGWVIVVACSLVMAAAMGIISNCASLFIKPISDDLGVSRRAVSTTISVLSIGAMITSLFAGRLFNDRNIVAIMRIAIIVMTVCFFCNSLFTTVQAFYITAAINGICQVMLTTMPITFILNNWFKTDVGTALGFASMGSGLGGALFNALAGKRIELYGWRMTYRILSVVIFVLAVPCIYILIKRKPEEKGCTPYEKGGKSADSGEIPRSLNTGVTFEEAKKTAFFWILCACAVAVGISMNAMYSSISSRLQDLGYSISFSANFLSIGMFLMAAGKILLGKIFDNKGVKVAFTLANASLLASQIGLLIAGKTQLGFLLVFLGMLFGLVYGAVCFPLAIPHIFGKKDYRAIMGPIAAAVSFGGAIGPILAGAIYDRTGSYNLAYVICRIIMAVVILRTFEELPDKSHQVC